MFVNQNSDSLKQQILDKLNQLLNKQEYYDYQERIYRTSKALNSIARSKGVEVSNFMDIDNETVETKDFSQENLEDVITALDELLLEKKDTNSIMAMLTTSSSSEDDTSESQAEVSKKCLLRNLFNLELTLRAQMHEKSLDTLPNTNALNSPLSGSKHGSYAFKSAGAALKKNFFEDKETQGFRRHSMGEKKIMTLETSFSGQKRRRSDDVRFVGKFFTIEEEGSEFVSNFLPDINEEDCKSDRSE
jgi:hypothetical protein